MKIDEIREYCLSLPQVTEDMPFASLGAFDVAFRIAGKMFALVSVDGDNRIALKCDPDYAVELREKWLAIQPAYHFNHKYWNQLDFCDGGVPEKMIRHLICHAYNEVQKKLTKTLQKTIPPLVNE